MKTLCFLLFAGFLAFQAFALFSSAADTIKHARNTQAEIIHASYEE